MRILRKLMFSASMEWFYIKKNRLDDISVKIIYQSHNGNGQERFVKVKKVWYESSES